MPGRKNAYVPPPEDTIHIPANEENMKPETRTLAWAEDVWYSIKKHWVIDLQRAIRARHGRMEKTSNVKIETPPSKTANE